MTRLIILLLVAVGLAALLMARPGGDSTKLNGEGALVSLDPTQVVQVDIQRPDGTVSLKRQADGWHLAAPYQALADQNLVNAIVGALSSLHSDGVISRNPDKAALFQVDAASGIRVALFYEGDTAPRTNLVVGKLAPGFNHTYVSVADGDAPDAGTRIDRAVYRVAGPIRYTLQRKANDWRDRHILHVPPDTITQLTLSRPQGELTLTLNRDAWQLSGDDVPEQAVPKGVIDHLLTRLAGLQASAFVDEPAEMGPTPLMTLSLRPKAAEVNPIDLVVEAKVDTGYRVVVDADPQRFVVATEPLQALLEDPLAALGID